MNDHPTERLSAYIDEELDAEEREQVERHLARCESCRAELADLMDMQVQIAQFYRQVEAPDELERKVLMALDADAKASSITRTSSAAIPLIGLTVLVALFGLYGSILVKLFSIAIQFVVTAAYVMSHVAASVPAIWIAVLALAIGLTLLSGLSLRRILRSSAQ